jgi:hypothetical protein
MRRILRKRLADAAVILLALAAAAVLGLMTNGLR